jgi:RNA polymerase sigma-70 factor (ECF subfamily)
MKLGLFKAQPQPRVDFAEYLDGLYGYAMVLSRNAAEAEDLVQETCLRALRSIDGLRADGSAKSWLFTILRNIWLNQLRHRRTAPAVVELDADGSAPNEPADPAQDPHSDYVSKLERERVRTAIEQLPVEFREIIIVREYEELSYEEIAAVLDCPLGTVRSRLARARSRLREMLLVGLLSPPPEKREAGQASETATRNQ